MNRVIAMDERYIPFWWRNDFDNARLHAVLVDFVNELFEATELVHGLQQVSCCRITRHKNRIDCMFRVGQRVPV